FGHGAGTAVVDTTAGKGSRLVLRLPERQDVGAVGVLLVIGDGKSLRPIPAVSIGDAHDPGPGAPVAAIGEGDAGSDLGELVRLLAYRQFQAGGAGCELGGAGAAGHGLSSVSRKCPGHGNRGQ